MIFVLSTLKSLIITKTEKPIQGINDNNSKINIGIGIIKIIAIIRYFVIVINFELPFSLKSIILILLSFDNDN